jgi:Domain of unknown function (DUF397)
MMRWRTGSRSGSEGGNCVQVGREDGQQPTAVRDSKNPTGPTLTGQITALVTAVKKGSIRA